MSSRCMTGRICVTEECERDRNGKDLQMSTNDENAPSTASSKDSTSTVQWRHRFIDHPAGPLESWLHRRKCAASAQLGDTQDNQPPRPQTGGTEREHSVRLLLIHDPTHRPDQLGHGPGRGLATRAQEGDCLAHSLQLPD